MTQNPPAIVGRHARAIRILTCLQSGPGFNAKELAGHLQVSRRTIYRDLSLIRAAGIGVTFDDKHSAYRLERSQQQFILPEFDDDDLVDLMLTAHLSLVHSFPEFRLRARQTMSKLICRFPHEVREQVSRMLAGCVVDLPQLEMAPGAVDAARTVLRAIGSRRQLRVEFLCDERRAASQVAPYRLEVGADAWFVVGRSSFHRRRHAFDLNRLLAAELTDNPFQPPRGARFFDRQAS